ncbi:non-ribosomal peptide synthetase [Musicola paradisiaca]|uniref:MCP methyltransferase, CheR-type n=1 Tax=Musicola paradisiaca (strain Ech703) TaxID=579405 RepID=C6CCJ4_MUSP7|nr:non-ribosomal peptide synthetase [Musicola paradisiaca]ACS86837.1 MCP methyltransferase, CheR-type [Musicola paradisiaca Ech703]
MSLAKNSVREILQQLEEHGADLQIKEGRLFLNEGDTALPAPLLAAVRNNKAQILEYVKIKNTVITDYPPLTTVRDKGDELPLSYSQERLWFLEELGLIGAAYNISDAVKIKGELNIDALQKSFDALVRRHTVLRTWFEKRGDGVVQRLEPAYRVDLKRIDLREERDQDGLLHLLAKEEGRKPFDLARGRLLRATLLQLAADEYVLLLTIHHIISDGWSMIVIIREINALYSSFIGGTPDRLPSIDFDYGDYVLWQRRWLTDEVIASELAYWRQQLEGAPNILEIPSDYPRPAIQRFEGRQHPFALGPKLSGAINQLANEEGLTPFMVLLAAFKLFLLRWTGQDDMVVGTGIAGRTHHQFEGLIGFFVNTLVMRTDLSGDPTFRTLLHRVRDVALNAYAHQHLPFEKLVAELSPERDLSRQPLVQVHIVLLNMPPAALELPRLTLTRIGSEMTTAKFDLSLFIRESKEQGFLCEFEYATDLYLPATVARMAEQLTALLQAVTAAPGEKLSVLPFLTETERHNQLRLWSGVTPQSQEVRCVHEVISVEAAQDPLAIAVMDEEGLYCRQELEHRSNQLAHFLRQAGIGYETVVAVCLPTGIDLIVSLLAILKAGGTYLALDTRHPPKRLESIMAEAGAAVMITRRASYWPGVERQIATCIMLDEQAALISQCAKTPPKVSIPLDNLAYLVYTSGSTGKPKGVMLSHRGLSNLALHQSHAFHISASSRVLQFASIAFDASVSEIFTTLYRGATLCLMGRQGFQSIEKLATQMVELRISVVTLPPAILSQLADYRFPHLATLIVAGEACAPAVAVDWARHCRLINAYGPSEATVCATWGEYDGSGRPPPIGTPLANVHVYLLDASLAVVPVGAVGELYLGGVALARGYHRQPGLTAERFIPSPFIPGERLYKTGDLARFLPDGQLDFLGRNDTQLKIRGHRIELGEIHTVLLSLEGVKQAYLNVNDGVDGSQLFAYVVMNHDFTHKAAYHDALDDSVQQWARLFDATGDVLPPVSLQQPEGEDYRPGFVGWNSSFTGQALPLAEMQQWLENTVARISRYPSRRILEIGCGSGLILQHLLADSDYYLGTDISANTLAKLKKWAAQQGDSHRLVLQQSPADALADLPLGQFDTVILNSVIQYFPDGHYLLDVLTQALQRLQPGGRIFIGDVQHLKLSGVFQTALELYKSTEKRRVGELRQRVKDSLQASKELAVDPQFFAWLPAYFEQISAVDIQLKRGTADNELVNYRYDVVLHTAPAVPVTPQAVLHWPETSLAQLAAELQQASNLCVSLNGVVNQRLVRDVACVAMIENASADLTLAALCPTFTADVPLSEQPETYWALAEQYGFEAQIRWSATADPAQFDVLFIRNSPSQPVQLALTRSTVSEQELLTYVNDPLKYWKQQQASVRLREQLQERLPDYMQPSAIILLEALPLTISGKVDTNALPAPANLSERLAYVPAGTPTEQVVIGCWHDILVVEHIGAQDNFFALGGHSLLATRVITALQAHFSVELSLRDVFEHPSVALLAAHIDRLHLCDRSLPALVPYPKQEEMALSYAQERLWFLEQLGLSGPAYNIADALELNGNLNLAALEYSFDQLLQRHEILRTRFSERDGIAVQQIDDVWAPDIEVEDLSALPDPEALAFERIRQEALQTFVLEQGHLIRMKLIKLEPQRHILAVTLHHIVSDGWSISILINEISCFYRGYILGAIPTLPPLPVQYVDYAIWQRQWLKGEVLTAQLDYWKRNLAQASSYLALPYDRPRPAIQSFRGGLLDRPIGKSLSDALSALATRHAATPFMLFMSAFNVLLARWSDQNDIVVGTPVAGRTHKALEGAIGFFVNTVVMRTQIDGRLPFSALLRQVKETSLSAWAHQDLPFEKLVAELQPQRDLSRQPVFQYQLVFLNIPEQQLDLEGLTLTPASVGTATAKYDLTLYVSENAAGFLCQFEYAEDLFDRTTIERMAEQFDVLLRDISVHDEWPVDRLQLLTEREQRQLLLCFNDTARQEKSWQPLHRRLSEQARQRPEKVVLIVENRRYRWHEIDARSNQLAHYLMACGVKPETVVGLCMDRSFDMLIALLAIMKAGGAYLPLDPHYPNERLAHMLNDSGARLLLVRQKTLVPVARYHGQRIDVDLCHDEIALQPTTLPSVEILPWHLAYIIYTSGSTGQPKGVMIEHRALMNFMDSMCEAPGLDEDDILLAVTPVSFDISALELFLPLLQQATLAIADREVATAGDALLTYFTHINATVMQATPSTWRMLIAAGWGTDQPCKILCGGEVMDDELLRQLLKRGEVWNLYGPTETTVWSTRQRLVEGDDNAWLGGPLANTQVYILDDALSLVPIGGIGEMYIGGKGLARGYYQRPSLTAERFIPSPFVPGERLYRTGDRVRMNVNHRIEYIGRLDYQVKLNGHRIELREIESVLLRQPEVEQAAVMARYWNENANERRLVAYLRPANLEITDERLQQQMQFSLHFFADVESQDKREDIYSLYLAAAQRADALGFTAVWTPERHFTDIAAAFPNPATLCAALATATKHIALRAGSVVAPLHNPLRIAEEWAVVDQLSGGRAGVAFATGWFADDFVLAPEHFADRYAKMQHTIETVQRLWRGDAVLMKNGDGQEVPIRSRPQPFQRHIPVWATAASDPASFIDAGRRGFNILTAMFGLTFDELAENIAKYRQAREAAGFAREEGTVTVMLHTFVAASEQEARAIAAEPLARYFRSHVTLREQILRNSPIAVTVDKRDIDKLVEISVERFLHDSALIGSMDSCLAQVRRLKRIGVNEVSCLIDFGIASTTVLNHLPNIIALRHRLAADIDLEGLQRNLKTQLPDIMIPTEFVVMEEFPLTPNGKLDRASLPSPDWGCAVDAWMPPQNAIQARLVAIWSDVLRLERIGINDNFFALGGDSIQSIQIVARARKVGIYFEARQLFENQTIAQLAAVVSTTVEAYQDITPEPFPLLPIQQWFFEQTLTGASHFNLSLTLVCRRTLAVDPLKQALIALINHHDALRLIFSRRQGQWLQQYGETASDVSLDYHDLCALDAAEHVPAMAAIADRMQRRLSIADNTLIVVSLVECGSQQPQRLLLVIHHLLVDGISWRILLEDLQTLYQQIEAGKPPALPRKNLSLQGWVEKLQGYAFGAQIELERAFWRQLADQARTVAPLPVVGQRQVNLAQDSRMLTQRLSAGMTEKLVRDLPRVFNTKINDVLLTALLQTFMRWTRQPRLLLHLEGHGREDLFPQTDISRTVGWFTSLFPVLLDEEGLAADSPMALLRGVKEQLRRIPFNGLGYGILRYLGQDAQLQAFPSPEISFNYLGNLDAGQAEDGLFSLSEQPMGELRHPLQQREHLIDISGALTNGCLDIYWTYNRTLHDAQTINQLAVDFMHALEALVEHSQGQKMQYTPSDFPLLGWKQQDLDAAFSPFGSHENVEDAYPLSAMQQGILFHSLYSGDPSAYYVTLSCTLSGHVEPTLFQQAWREVILRHPALRTAIIAGESPLQVVLREADLEFQVVDWQHCSDDLLKRRMDALVVEDRQRAVNFARPSLMRIYLIKQAEKRYRLIWGSHLIILDGWSVPIVLGEVINRYQGWLNDVPVQLESVGAYRDYIAWLRRQDNDKAQAWWGEQLKGFTTPTQLGRHHHQRRAQVGQQGNVHQEYNQRFRADINRLEQFCQQHRITLNTLVQGVWAELLCRYTGCRDVIFGVTVSGRPAELPAIENSVGLFISTLPFRASFAATTPLIEWLLALQETQTQLFRYQYSSLVDIHRWSEIPDSSLLFESVLVYENYPTDKVTGTAAQEALTISDINNIERNSFPLTLVFNTGDALRLKWVYDSQHFEHSAILRLAEAFEFLLMQIVSAQEQTLASLRLFDEPNYQRLTQQFSTRTACQRVTTLTEPVHRAIARQAQRYPERIALVFRDATYSYRQLNNEVNQLARYLRLTGIAGGSRIGICMDNSSEMIIALLGVLKAGASYVPLDRYHPQARLAYMVNDAKPALIITDIAGRESVTKLGTSCFCLSDEKETLSAFSVEELGAIEPDGDDEAYVIYTSGTTGWPKGVSIGHAAFGNYVAHAVDEYLSLDNTSRSFASYVFLPLTFDASVTAIYAPLVAGKAIFISDANKTQPFSDIPRADAGFEFIKLTPAHLRLLQIKGERLENVDRLVVGGEALTANDLQQCAEIAVINEYGPTETTVGSTLFRTTAGKAEAKVPIGRPIRNVTHYVFNQVDGEIMLAPIGMAGELYIGGVGVALGYVNNAALTERRFITSPFNSKERLYRTGDRVCWREDGVLEYLGRVDRQVKLRGYRIEEEEIEAVIRAIDGVREAAVTLCNPHSEQAYLAAYVVMASDNVAEPAAVREQLQAALAHTLPRDLIPSRWSLLPALPLTRNGKVDYAGLAAMPPEEESPVALSSTLEIALAEIWSEVLEPSQIGASSRFFDLGGNSLNAMRIVVAIKKKYGVMMPIGSLLDNPSFNHFSAQFELLLMNAEAVSPSDGSEEMVGVSGVI